MLNREAVAARRGTVGHSSVAALRLMPFSRLAAGLRPQLIAGIASRFENTRTDYRHSDRLLFAELDLPHHEMQPHETRDREGEDDPEHRLRLTGPLLEVRE